MVNAKNRKTVVFSAPAEEADSKLQVKLEEEQDIGEQMKLEVLKPKAQ